MFSSKKTEKIKELTAANEALQVENDKLRSIIGAQQKLINNVGSKEGGMNSVISDKNLSAYVENYLRNPSHNISWIPDSIERVPYMEGTKLTLVALAAAFDNSSVDLFGHRIKIVIEPIEDI